MSPFEQELKESVTNYFRNEANKRGITLLQSIKATPQRWLEMLVIVSLTLVSLYFLVKGKWWSLFVAPTLLWLTAANICHDAMHFSISTKWWLNAAFGYLAPFTSSPLMWYHQHVIGHHAYPNVSHKDPDLAHAPSLMRVHDSISWKPSHRFQMITTPIIWTLGATLYMTVVPFKTILKGTFNRAVFLMRITKLRLYRHIAGRIIIASMLWVWPWFVFPLWQAVIWCTIPMFLHSFWFMACTQMNHLTPMNAKSSDKEYSRHQVVTSHTFAPYSRLVFYLTGGLNLQIEHHLFPTVNHCHLPALHFIVKDICAKHNVPYHESAGFFEALTKYAIHIRDMSFNPTKLL